MSDIRSRAPLSFPFLFPLCEGKKRNYLTASRGEIYYCSGQARNIQHIYMLDIYIYIYIEISSSHFASQGRHISSQFYYNLKSASTLFFLLQFFFVTPSPSSSPLLPFVIVTNKSFAGEGAHYTLSPYFFLWGVGREGGGGWGGGSINNTTHAY